MMVRNSGNPVNRALLQKISFVQKNHLHELITYTTAAINMRFVRSRTGRIGLIAILPLLE